VYEDGMRDPYQRRLISIFWVFALVVACIWLLWRISQILLMLFAALLGAVLLDGLACYAKRRLGLPHAPAITLIITVLGFIFIGFGFVVGPTLMNQSQQLTNLIPQSLNQMWTWAQAHHWDEILIATKPSRLVPSATDLLGELSGIFSTTIGGLASMLIIILSCNRRCDSRTARTYARPLGVHLLRHNTKLAEGTEPFQCLKGSPLLVG